jgi:hypothetical protein
MEFLNFFKRHNRLFAKKSERLTVIVSPKSNAVVSLTWHEKTQTLIDDLSALISKKNIDGALAMNKMFELLKLADENEEVVGYCRKNGQADLWIWGITQFGINDNPSFRFKPQFERNLFDQLMATWYGNRLFSKDLNIKTTAEKMGLLIKAKKFGNFHAIRDILCENVKVLLADNKKVSVDVKSTVLNVLFENIRQLTRFHGSAGYLFAACLFVYIGKSALLFDESQRFIINQRFSELKTEEAQSDQAISVFLKVALIYFRAAWLLESYSYAAVNNAFLEDNAVTVINKRFEAPFFNDGISIDETISFFEKKVGFSASYRENAALKAQDIASQIIDKIVNSPVVQPDENKPQLTL